MLSFDCAPLTKRRDRRKSLRLETFEERTVPAIGIGANFGGVGTNLFGPFGNSGAIGPNNFVEFLTNGFVVFDRAGNFVPFNNGQEINGDETFWELAGIPTSVTASFVFQPRIIYDPLSDRWFAMEITLASTGNQVLVGRSDTNNPAGTWQADFYTATTGFADFPTLALDANGVYIGTLNFTDNTATADFLSGTMTSIPKADLLQATPTVANRTMLDQPNFDMGIAVQGVTNFNPNSDHATVLGVDFLSLFPPTGNQIDRTRITGTGGPNATFSPTDVLSVDDISFPDNCHQPDGTRTIYGGTEIYSSTIYQVGDLIYAVLSISVDPITGQAVDSTTNTNSVDGVRLTVLSDSTGQVVAEGTYFAPTFDYSFPSVSANLDGDIVIGFSRSGSVQGSGPTDGNLGAYSVYAHIDPANPGAGITFGPEVQLQPGLVRNYHQSDNAFWGVYSATSPDPTNPTSFWTTQEWVVNSTTWASLITQVFVSPRVGNVSSTLPDGTYFIDDNIPITITFNDAVTVTGTPQLALNTGGIATYTSGSGTKTLTFTYTVAPGQATADLDDASVDALSLNGGTITDSSSGLDAELPLPAPGAPGSLGANKDIVIDPVGKVKSVTSPSANGRYGAGTVITISVVFNQPVTVTGTPSLALNTGVNATYTGGSGTDTLTFTYTVALGESSADLDYTSTNALSLNGGTIIDVAFGQNADLTLAAPGAPGSLGANKDIIIDTTAPHVTGVSAPGQDGNYGFGETIHITVTFHKAVAVTGAPQITLNSGGTAIYASGSGTNTLVFDYMVGAGDLSADLDYTSTSALDLNGGTIIEGSSGLAADITLPAPGAAGSLGANNVISVDATEAKVTNVTSSKPNGNYGIGAIVDITIKFQRPMNVTGTPLLALNSGGTASYLSGSGTDTLTFRYTVGSGENAADLDYASTNALTLNGGTIQEASGLPANLTLPAPGSAGSLGANKNIVIDTVGPTIVEFRVLFGTKWFNLLSSPRTVLPWQVKGIQVVFSEPVYSGNVRSLGGLTATAFKGLRTRILTWNFPAISKGSFNATLASAGAAALKDQAGNAIAAFTRAFSVLYGDFDGNGVVNSDDEKGIRANIAGPYQLNPSGYNIFADLSGDGIVNLVDVGIAHTRNGQSLP